MLFVSVTPATCNALWRDVISYRFRSFQKQLVWKIKDASCLYSCGMLCWDKCACLVWKNPTSIDFSDRPLHTHRSHLFEPVQSGRVFLFVNCCHFSIYYSCLITRKSSIYSSVDVLFSFHTRYVMVSPALTRFWTSVAVPDVAALWLSSLQLSAAVERSSQRWMTG